MDLDKFTDILVTGRICSGLNRILPRVGSEPDALMKSRNLNKSETKPGALLYRNVPGLWFKYGLSDQLNYLTINGTSSRATMLTTLMTGFRAGPAVSL